MKQKKWIRALIVLVILAAVIAVIALASGGVETFEDKYKDADLSRTGGAGDANRYSAYLSSWAGVDTLGEPIAIEGDALADFAWLAEDESAGIAPYAIDAPVEPEKTVRDESGRDVSEHETGMKKDEEGVLYTRSGSFLCWTVDAPAEAMVNIEIEYRAPRSRGVDIERALYLDDGSGLAVPFECAEALTFFRIWQDEEGKLTDESRMDSQGTQRRPSQGEISTADPQAWQTVRIKDSMGYVVEPYQFHLRAGENRIALKATNEPMEIRAIRLVPVQSFRTYEDYQAQFEGRPDSVPADLEPIVIEAEGSRVDAQETRGEDGKTRWVAKVADDWKRRSSSPSL